MNTTRTYRRGDIYLAKTNPRIGPRGGAKAVLLLQNDAEEYYSTSVFAVPIAMRPSPFLRRARIYASTSARCRWCSTTGSEPWTSARSQTTSALSTANSLRRCFSS